MLSNIISLLSGLPQGGGSLPQQGNHADLLDSQNNLEVGATAGAYSHLTQSPLEAGSNHMPSVGKLRLFARSKKGKLFFGGLALLLGLTATYLGSSAISTKDIQFLPAYTKLTMHEDPSSPQARALQFLRKHPDYKHMPDWRKRQFFALRCFWEGLTPKPKNLLHMKGHPNECDWWEWPFHGLCDDEGRYTQLKANLGHTVTRFTGGQGKGPLPPEISFLSDLETLHLFDGILTGTLPTQLGLMTSLTNLQCQNNALTGTLPSQLGLLTNVMKLDLDHNHLTGSLPSEVGSMLAVNQIQIADNQINSTIPSQLGYLSKLEVISLGQNLLSGNIPSELGKSTLTTKLFLHENLLEGSLPSELGNLESLEKLRINQNDISGMVASEMGQLKHLVECKMHGNKRIKGHHSSPLLCIV